MHLLSAFNLFITLFSFHFGCSYICIFFLSTCNFSFFSPTTAEFPTMTSHQGMLTLALTMVILAFPSLICGDILHVRPTSTNTSCPTYPCGHTLSEYAQRPARYFNHSYLTLEFLPGNHTLDVNLTIRYIHQLELLGSTGAVAQTRVVCTSTVGLTFRDISEMRIDSLAFVSCARLHLVMVQYGFITKYFELHLQSVQTAVVNDCTF